jgi:probable HAF family extracellular repeat protein
MRRMMLLVGAAFAALAVSGAAGSGSAGSGQARWVIRDLGTLGGYESRALDVNERGQVVGKADTVFRAARIDVIQHGFLWENGTMRDLGTLGGPDSEAVDVNERGQVVGTADTREREGGYPIRHAFLWRNGKIRDLGPIRRRDSEASGINNRGEILIHQDQADAFKESVFLWVNGSIRALPPDKQHTSASIDDRGRVIGVSGMWKGEKDWLWQNGEYTELNFRPSDINTRGQIVGTGPSGDWSKAVKWTDGRMEILTPPTRSRTLGSMTPAPASINDSGLVVGNFVPKGLRSTHPCLWRGTQGQEISLPTGAVSGTVHAVNNSGQVLGEARMRAANDHHAFVWENGTATDLGTLGGRYSEAMAINENNQIVGSATTKSGQTHAVLWTLRSG